MRIRMQFLVSQVINSVFSFKTFKIILFFSFVQNLYRIDRGSLPLVNGRSLRRMGVRQVLPVQEHPHGQV